ncbi:MAG: polysaccharide deacetylase family protein [Candidatus Omnitrophica bacterium]|nr:polysaccharide deacetylase family protein [Candidatus Omnitrophota bacterium]MDD5487545.1 polysaccharide deacetylase family protein [Candidatus Omnitrophota bacterium]
MRKITKVLVAIPVFTAILAVIFYFAYMSPRRTTPILMYHSVSKDKASTLNVTPKNFARQMQYLRDKGYSVISLKDLVAHINKGERYVPRTVVVTFDDGFEDNYLYAFPVLSQYGMPATIFMISGYVDKREGYLTWEQIRLMMRNDISFGAHTRNNVYLPSIKDNAKLKEEIYGAKDDIQRMTGREVDFFCYPTGGFNDGIKDMVKKAGYKGACTTNRGLSTANEDVYELKRVKVTNSDTVQPLHFEAKLSGFYNVFRRLKEGE